MKHYNSLFAMLETTALQDWAAGLQAALSDAENATRHGDWRTWQQVLDSLPSPTSGTLQLNQDWVEVGNNDHDPELISQLENLLQGLHPWRKGPFRIHGLTIDAEWRSNLKWDRIAPAVSPLRGRLVLDVGCGNGYYGWRMLGEGARLVLGIDPTWLFVAQYRAIGHFLGELPSWVLPLSLEQLPAGPGAFDTVFSMGVFYHRRSPMDHLLRLLDCLRPGGELVLETLVIDGEAGQVLVPPDRYARMRNVWFLPSPDTLLGWLRRCGYRNPRLLDVTATTIDEQRGTPWMRFHSLADFLDPEQPGLTREGLPAPIRAIVIAEKPE